MRWHLSDPVSRLIPPLVRAASADRAARRTIMRISERLGNTPSGIVMPVMIVEESEGNRPAH
jgi:hypothetical protein